MWFLYTEFRSLPKRTGHGCSDRQTMVSDGATWIDRMANRLFPGATMILDFFHASQHVYQACETHYGGDKKRAVAKFEELKAKLKYGELVAVVNSLR